MEKTKGKIDYNKIIIYSGFLLLGYLLGCLFIYKIEINTLNQAFESLRYCYETYGGFK